MVEVPRPQSTFIPACEIPTTRVKTHVLGDRQWHEKFENDDILGYYEAPLSEAGPHHFWFRHRNSRVHNGLAMQIMANADQAMPGFLPRCNRSNSKALREDVARHEGTHFYQQLRTDAPRLIAKAGEALDLLDARPTSENDTGEEIGAELEWMAREIAGLCEAQALLASVRSKDKIGMNRMAVAQIARVGEFALTMASLVNGGSIMENTFKQLSQSAAPLQEGEEYFLSEYCILLTRNPNIFTDINTGKVTLDEFKAAFLEGVNLIIGHPHAFFEEIQDPAFQIQLDQNIMEAAYKLKSSLAAISQST